MADWYVGIEHRIADCRTQGDDDDQLKGRKWLGTAFPKETHQADRVAVQDSGPENDFEEKSAGLITEECVDDVLHGMG
jgi:hypothetical protein